MIIIRMSGGLGNQMFQYALYLKLRQLGREAAFEDTSQYDEEAFRNSDQKRRPKRLGIFGIQYPVASKEDVIRLTDGAMDLPSRVRRKVRGRRSLEKADQDFVFDASFLQETEGYYCGCFQSPRYFEGAEDEVRKAFTFPSDLLEVKEGTGAQEKRILEQAAGYARRIEEINDAADARGMQGRGGSASIHLRFGDYVTKGDIYGGICTDGYYNTSIRELQKVDSEMTFFVFSNDEEKAGEWIRYQAERSDNLGRGRFVLVKGSDEDHGYLDLYLMTLCRNHIIANSSFSWWGAWLCSAPGKKIYAPSIWNNTKDGSELARTDIYAKDMIRISPSGHLLDETPLISVIVTAYNVEPYIAAALDSVRSQTWKHLEIIVVDDGSTDGTGKLLDEYARQDSRIRVIHTPNGGVSAARNIGLDYANGQYVGFVDGDDYAHPEMYETLVRGMLASGAQLAVANYREVTSKQNSQSQEETEQDGADLIGADSIGTGQAEVENGVPAADMEGAAAGFDPLIAGSVLLRQRDAVECFIRAGLEGTDGRVVLHPAVWSKLFHRSVLKGNRFPEGTSAEDIPFTTYALCRARKVLYQPAPLYDYVHNRSESIMNSGRAIRTLTQEIPAWRTHLTMLEDAGLGKIAEESEYWFYRRMLFYEEDYRRCEDTRTQAKELEERILRHKDRILELCGRNYGRRGDRERLKLYVQSPKAYYHMAALYEKTVVAWKNRV